MNLNQFAIQAFSQVFSTYWWLWSLLAILSFLKTPFMKGVIGEALVFNCVN